MTEQAQTDIEQPAENADELAALNAEAIESEPGIDEAGEPVEAEPEEQPSISNQQAIQMLLAPAFGALAPRWQVQPEEIAQLAQAYGDLADKYLPDGIHVGVELNAALVTLIVLGPRMGTPRTEAEAKKAEQKKAAKKEQSERKKEQDNPPSESRAENPDSAEQKPAFDESAFSDDAENTPKKSSDNDAA